MPNRSLRRPVDAILSSMTHGDKLQLLTKLSPSDVADLEGMADDCIRFRWPKVTPFPVKATLRPRRKRSA